MIDNILMEMWRGIFTLINFIPLASCIYLCVMVIELLVEVITQKRIKIKIVNWVCQYLWILIILAILKITGILGGNFGISSPLDSYISFQLFEDGFNMATVLNIVLFIPYGFLPVFIFKNLMKHWWNGILIGLVFSIIIEFLQTFIGRFAQLDDVVMNTCGAFLGFLMGSWIARIHDKKQ